MARREIEIPLSRFGVLVAQLESIVASAPQQTPDALLCFDLLSELVAAIQEEPKESILQWQRKCEDALYSLLALGARRPVRRLASIAMGKVISKGDGISIYSRASSLQGWLADGKRSEPHSCAGVAQCLGELYRLFGRRITSGLSETIHIVAKLMKFNEDFVRKDALQMLANALDGSGGNGASTAYLEAFRIIMRVGVSDKSFIVKLAAAGCLRTFASIGGPGLGITELESSISYCLKALEDSVSAIRDAFSEALGALIALAMNPEAQVRHKVKVHALPAKKLDDGLVKHLILPFTRASGVRAKEMRIGLALSFVFFLQVVRLKYGAPDSELQNFAFQAIDMLQGNAHEDSHALACVLYILRVGVADQMTEPTQRIFLVLLGKKLGSADYSPSVGVVILRILSYLLTTLGEVPLEFKEVLDDTIVAALSHPSLHVRIEAALTLRALAEVDPTCVGGLISYGVTTLHALRETMSPEKGSHLNLELDSLHGQATILAALVSISPRLLLGYPARLPKLVFEVSKKMLVDYSRNPVVATVEKEAGWMLLASLLASMTKEELEDQVFDVLLLWAGPLLGSEFHIRQTQDLTSEIRVLSAAMEALTAFIRSFVQTTPVATNGGVLLQPVLAYLSGALSYISIFSSEQMQSMIKPALDMFTMRTILAYESLSNPMAYKSEHPQLLQICTSPFGDTSRCEESSCLRFLLDKRDACLGPWIPGRDWFEDELRAFDGCKDGIMPCVWDYQLSSFPQLESVRKMLVNQMLLFFGTIFASQDNGGKLVLLNMIDQCLKIGKKQPWHRASITNACVALLSGLKAALSLRSQSWEIEILTSIQSIFQGILVEGEISSEQRRASAEGLGLLTRLGNDVFTAKMARSLLGELVVATDPNYIGSIALSLGCIHRSAGGMALSTLVPATVSSISNLAKSSNPGLQLWSLHALLLTIEAAGLSYVSQVQATLFLAIEILLSEENGLVDIREEIGRIINAIVAVLGPELAPGSTFFSRCKSVIAEISSCQETSTLLESVRFTQQLVLFAPQAVSVHSHVHSLLPTLFSKQPSLRYLAASTLRHLIEKDPVAMIDEKIEENLFSMLDEETDTEIGNLVRTTITRLLYASCPSVPFRWLAILNSLVLATSIRRNTSENRTASENDRMKSASEGDSGLYYGEDDENMISRSNQEQMQEPVSVSSANPKRVKHLRYRTRIFAAECLSYVPTAVGTEPAHFDLTLARQQSKEHTGSGDWLVLHLQELISLSYQISTGQIEGMQHIGVRLLCIILDKYEHLPDPELPGHLLVEQYQAQLVSAARAAISPSSGPLLLEAGLQLATKILTSSIISGDRVALNRMFSLISRPLDEINDLYYPSFAEWVACKIKIRLLAAHASIKCYVYSFLKVQKEIPDEYLPLIPLFSSKSGILGKYWTDVLKDYCYICFSLQSNLKYKPFLDGIQSPVVSSKVKGCLDEAWPVILQAAVLDSVPSKFEGKLSRSDIEGASKEMFVSGWSMVKLEFGDFQFLWGLALLVLFHGQELEVGKRVKLPLFNIEKKHDQNCLVKESHYLTYSEIALVVFQSLSKERFLSQGFLPLDLCREIFQVLTHADQWTYLKNRGVLHVLLQIVQYCPESFFEKEDFISAATELCVKYLHITFQSENAILKDSYGGKDLLSALSFAAETIACRIKHKQTQWKLIAVFMSICYECYTGASTDLCILKVFTFLMKIAPFLRTKFSDDTEGGSEDYTDKNIILGAWVSTLTFLSQDCTRRIHGFKNSMNDSFKLRAKILNSCLEEVVALAKLVYEIKGLEEDKDSNLLHLSVYKHCLKCIGDTLSDMDIQVQIIGLHVLKSFAQREVTDGTDMETRSFFCAFAGEFFGDIFLIIQNTHKGGINKETMAAADECLRLFFLIHTLSQGSEFQQAFITLLLEALVMVHSIADENHSQEANEAKATARKLVSHLVQSPSFAIQIKDVMVSMQVTRRQQLQDIIRMSVMLGQMPTPTQLQAPSVSHGHVMTMQPNAIIAPPINKLNKQSEIDTTEDSHLNASEIEVRHASNQGADTTDADAEDDDEDDWDTFQSLPADITTVSTSEQRVEVISDNNSFTMESSHEKLLNSDIGEVTNAPSNDQDMETSDPQHDDKGTGLHQKENKDDAMSDSPSQVKAFEEASHENELMTDIGKEINTLSSDQDDTSDPQRDNKGMIDTIDLQQKESKDNGTDDLPSEVEIFEEASHTNNVVASVGEGRNTLSIDEDMEPSHPHHDEGTTERIDLQEMENKDDGNGQGISDPHHPADAKEAIDISPTQETRGRITEGEENAEWKSGSSSQYLLVDEEQIDEQHQGVDLQVKGQIDEDHTSNAPSSPERHKEINQEDGSGELKCESSTDVLQLACSESSTSPKDDATIESGHQDQGRETSENT
ncbi:hypothetical protein J5N97_028040 [Dioscorea zingiberensis]|uniref:HEAT repeat-containing protein 5B n=1 Tax=Dioscorea zingiberensis TaxID=325984 RepID=A0A9D5BY92_9LILI|nr:hypothetical protein J5N97_028040 [Dioscorea zingiberensis]